MPNKVRIISLAIFCVIGFGILAGLAVVFRPKPKPPVTIVSESFVRKVAPPVFRSVLDDESRMLTIQLDEKLWLAYSTQFGVLRRVWRDGVDLVGPVYNYSHGSQPLSKGPAYCVDPGVEPWRIVSSNGEFVPTFEYKGHRFVEGKTILMYQFIDANGEVFSIEETPHLVVGEQGNIGLKRSFEVRGLPDGSAIHMEVKISSLATLNSYQTNGVFNPIRINEDHVFGRLILNSSESTDFIAYFGEPEIQQSESVSAPMHEGYKLVSRSDCAACHDINGATVGPSFRAIADRYRSNDNAVSLLAEKIIVGGYGTWGQAAMNPHPQIKNADAETMVDWIMSLPSIHSSADSSSASVTPSFLQRKLAGLKTTLWIWHRDFQAWRRERSGRPGDTLILEGAHPSFDVQPLRPAGFQPRVGGLDLFEDGRIAISTWDTRGSVYIFTPGDASTGTAPMVEEIASGLAEPLGLKIVDGIIYVMQKQELTRLVDADNDGQIDRYETVSNRWGVGPNFHEFGFGLRYRDNKFYATLGTAILNGGLSVKGQDKDRGTIITIDPESGGVEFIARGVRTPNGIGYGVDEEFFVTDNEGDWLPANKLIHVKEGAFYGSRSVNFEGTEGLPVQPAAVLLPRDEIANSPSEPVTLNVGPYKNQMLFGDATHGGLKRVFLEKINGDYQGVVFRFSQGFEAGVNRVMWDNQGGLIVGGVGGGGGNWSQTGKLAFGLERMVYTGAPVFEMLTVRALNDGFEIEFTEPLKEGAGDSKSDYLIQDWYYIPTWEYGGDKIEQRELKVDSVEVSSDRKKVRLGIPDLKEDRVVYFRLKDDSFESAHSRNLWTTEAWYTLNSIPKE